MNNHTHDNIADLVSRYFEDDLSRQEEHLLARLLEESVEARQLMASYMELEGSIARMGASKLIAAEVTSDTSSGSERRTPVTLTHVVHAELPADAQPVQMRLVWPTAFAAAAAVAAALILSVIEFVRAPDTQPDMPRIASPRAPSAPAGNRDEAAYRRQVAHRVEQSERRNSPTRPPRRLRRPVDADDDRLDTDMTNAIANASRGDQTRGRPDGTAIADAEQPSARTPVARVLFGYIDSLQGDVEVSESENEWIPATPGHGVHEGDLLRTKYARARVVLESGTVLFANRFTTIEFVSRPVSGVSMIGGEVYVEVDDADNGFFVDTPQGRTVDLGTAFAVSTHARGTDVVVASGSVTATTDAGTVQLKSSEEVRLASRSLQPGTVHRVRSLSSRISWTWEIGAADGSRHVSRSLRSGLVAYWSFDDGFGRVARNIAYPRMVGSIKGATWTTGIMGPALRLDGNDCIVVNWSRPLDMVTDSITVVAWVTIDEISPFMKILGRSDRFGGGYKMHVVNGRFDFRIMTDERDSTNIGESFLGRPGGAQLQPGRWYHLAGTFSNTDHTIRTYVNGVLDRQMRITLDLNPGHGPLVIGRQPTVTTDQYQYWDGKLDEICIYARALDATEIRELAAHRGLR